MQITLAAVSSTCAHAQRTAIALEEKGVSYGRELLSTLDLAQCPAFFAEISQEGHLPVLVSDGRTALDPFLYELVEDLFPTPALFPSDPILRAQDRAWLVVANERLLPAIHEVAGSRIPDSLWAAKIKLDEMLARFDTWLEGGDYLSGDRSVFGMADVIMAPAATRLTELAKLYAYRMPDACRRVEDWVTRMGARTSVQRSLPTDFAATFRSELRRAGSIVVAPDPG